MQGEILIDFDKLPPEQVLALAKHYFDLVTALVHLDNEMTKQLTQDETVITPVVEWSQKVSMVLTASDNIARGIMGLPVPQPSQRH
jgi:hypothetical protein